MRIKILRCILFFQGNLFGSLDDGLYGHPDGLQATADISKATPPSTLIKHDALGYGPYGGDMSAAPGHHGSMGPRGAQMTPLHAFGESMLDQLSAASINMSSVDHSGLSVNGGGGGSVGIPSQQMYQSAYSSGHQRPTGPVSGHPGHPGQSAAGLHCLQQGLHHAGLHPMHSGELGDCDTRELEAFAEHFKQRRIKIGVTQADVGSALGKLKIPGVGSLSQSTICRFESLTLSHNNMVALKPVLQAWLEEAEKAARENRMRNDLFNGAADKKRKRTSIAAPEKRSLEAYFAIQPRPSGEKIAQIADKLDLKKNVVRVWFCNQRQKQKRMKFSAATLQGPH